MKIKIKRIIRVFGFTLFIYLPVFAGNQKQTTQRPDYSISPQLQFSSDSMIQLPPVLLPPEKFVSETQLLNDCFYCLEENRRWYETKDDLLRAVQVCHCDYLQTRIESAFQSGNIKAFIVVHGRFDLKKQFTIDSVQITVMHQNSTNRTVVYSTNDNIRQHIVLPVINGADNFNLPPFINELFNISSANRISFAVGAENETFRMNLTIGGSVYLVNNKGIQNVSPENADQTGSQCRTAFKIGLYSENYPCAHKSSENPPEIKLFSIRYFLNECIADIQVKALEGISGITFRVGTFEKKIELKGEPEFNSSIPFNVAFDSSAILQMKVVDRKGNVTQAVRPVFETLPDVNKRKKESDDLQRKRDAWTQKNGVNKTLNVISKLENNPVSWVLNKIIKKNAVKLYHSEPDYINSAGFDTVLLPIKKRILLNGTDSSIIICSQRIFAESLKKSGLKIWRLDGVTLNEQLLFTDFSLSAIYADGRYRCSWAARQDSVQKKGDDLFFLCKKAGINDGKLTISEIPFTIEKAADRIEYSLVSMHSLSDNDTLIYTYLIWYSDRTKEVIFREIALDGNNEKKIIKKINGSSVLSGIDRWYKNSDAKIVLSDEILTAEKDIFRVDVSAYCCKTATTIAISSIWVCR